MYRFFVVIFVVVDIFVDFVLATSSANYFCADMKPQNSIDIEQLMGMWYGIEVISHKQDEEHAIIVFDTCPVVHLSEIHPPTTISPLFTDHGYGMSIGSGYGSGYGYGYHQTQPPQLQDNYYNREYYGRPSNSYGYTTSSSSRSYNRDRDRDRNRDGYSTGYGGRQYGDTGRYDSTDPTNRGRHLNQRPEPMKRLRLMWDEAGQNTEYLLRYNVTRAGFWISSGPQNDDYPDLQLAQHARVGSILEKQYNQFAGTIQVMKAVGNHLVLTFCHQLPERQLYSVLLSREPRLSRQEVHGVHNLLNRRELSTNHIKKVCSTINGSTSLYILKDIYSLIFLTTTILTTIFFSSNSPS